MKLCLASCLAGLFLGAMAADAAAVELKCRTADEKITERGTPAVRVRLQPNFTPVPGIEAVQVRTDSGDQCIKVRFKADYKTADPAKFTVFELRADLDGTRQSGIAEYDSARPRRDFQVVFSGIEPGTHKVTIQYRILRASSQRELTDMTISNKELIVEY